MADAFGKAKELGGGGEEFQATSLIFVIKLCTVYLYYVLKMEYILLKMNRHFDPEFPLLGIYLL